MIAVTFTQDIIEKLRTERFNHPSPKVQLKMEALYPELSTFNRRQCVIERPFLMLYYDAIGPVSNFILSFLEFD